MLLIPRLKPDGSANLDAYSYSAAEIAAVGALILSLGFEAPTKRLPRDRVGRPGKRYALSSRASSAVQSALGIDFSTGRFIFRPEHGLAFRCIELALNSRGGGCVNIVAGGAAEATVKCALVANERGWLGGVAQEGSCPDQK